MGKSHYDMAHDFYYLGVDMGKCTRYQAPRVTYDGCDAFSYSTIVAKVIQMKNRGGRPTTLDTTSGLTLVSFETMTASTSKHISLLRHASPFECVSVPMTYGVGNLSSCGLRDNFLRELKYLSEHLNHVRERTRFVELMNARQTLLDKACEEWAKPLRDRRFRQYEDILANLDDWRKNLKKRLAEKAKREAAAARRVVSRYLAKAKTPSGMLDAYRGVFSFDSEVDPEARKKLREALTKEGESYVWVDGDEVRTSQHVRVPVKAVKTAMHAWALGHDMRKWLVDRYAVVKYEGDVIQIGCHRIPRKNILALYEVLMGRKFEMRKAV